MNTFKLTIVAAVLGLSLGQALAVPVPLNHPKGLALDSKGNLYVANSGNLNTGNRGQVLVYATNAVQKTAKNIDNTALVTPVAVALNSFDQLYVVSNWNQLQVYNGTVQDYTKQLTNFNGVYYPNGIAIDGMDNIWVSNSQVGCIPCTKQS